jgi:hypothetical protein
MLQTPDAQSLLPPQTLLGASTACALQDLTAGGPAASTVHTPDLQSESSPHVFVPDVSSLGVKTGVVTTERGKHLPADRSHDSELQSAAIVHTLLLTPTGCAVHRPATHRPEVQSLSVPHVPVGGLTILQACGVTDMSHNPDVQSLSLPQMLLATSMACGWHDDPAHTPELQSELS